MSVIVRIPTPLRRFAADHGEIEVEAATVGEALSGLVAAHPALARHLFDDGGRRRSFVNVFVNDEDSRHLGGDQAPVAAGDTVSIVPSIAGGSSSGGLFQPPSTRGARSSGLTPESGFARPPTRADAAVLAPAAAGVDELPDLEPEEIRRYSRHLIMPEVGTEGQRRLKAAKVLMIGTGGLGSPLGLYLAAAGVGRLGLVDFDRVDLSNLHRQVLYSDADVGRPKIAAAIERLHGVNPHVELVPHETRLDSKNALELFADYDLVVDGTDNFPTRYLVNDACVLAGKPNVYGSIFRFEGQVSVFWGARGPCYRCLFPEPPPPGLVPSCAEGGVLGVLPGIIGALQANEAIKLIVGEGEPLIGRLLLFDALKLQFRELKLRKSPDCPVCSERPTQTALIDYEQFCGVPAGGEAEAEAVDGIDIDVHTLRRWLAEGRALTVLDVRNPPEYEICRLEGSLLIPLPELPDRLGELDTADTLVVHCHHGPRSSRAVAFLRGIGFERAFNLAGGIDAWSVEIDPSVPRY